jgi:biopolymer transport protein ExbB
MKNRFSAGVAVLLLSVTALLHGEETVDDALKRATLEYGQRLRLANEELTQTRERIAREKAPLLKAMRDAEDRIIAAQALTTRLETGQEQSAENSRKLGKEADALRKNESYLNTLAHDSLNAYDEGLLPGERQFFSDAVQVHQEQFGDPAKLAGGQKAMDVANFMLERVRQSLGGYTLAGSSLIEGDNTMIRGTFAFAGPETFFRPEQGGVAGTVRVREGIGHPVTYLLREWKPAAAEAFFQGRMGTIYADASAGKSLRLKETKGTVWQHINKGGVVSYAIICVGLLALIMILLKVRDLARMAVDKPDAVQQCLVAVAADDRPAAEQCVRSLKGTTRELLDAGLFHLDESKTLLEDALNAVLLRQRLYYERRLPLLAVIATAAPLMGLLGTVTGMVRTFALITVFGTGNAGKLASGISEVLVSTELGLVVAIPTLIAHGFLSHRIQKNLSLLECYAVEFVNAVQRNKSAVEPKESIPA